MRIIYDIGKHKLNLKRPVLGLGIFDGVHLGHRRIIKTVKKNAKKINGTSVIFTFWPHPQKVIGKKNDFPYLCSLKKRLDLIGKLGIDVVIVERFSLYKAKITSKNFIKDFIAKKISPKIVVVGKDFVFGKGRRGNIALLKSLGKQFCFRVDVVELFKIGGRTVRSQLIRGLIKKGKLDKAAKLLKRPVSFEGEVISGARRGRALGYPTANIKLKGKILLPLGVYAVRVLIGNSSFLGMANLGFRPTLKKEKFPLLEIYIFDFNKNIYGKYVEVQFLKKMRKEKKFKKVSDLRYRLKRDEKKIKNFLTHLY